MGTKALRPIQTTARPGGGWAQVKRVIARPQFRFGLLVLAPLAAWYVYFCYRPIFYSFWMAVVRFKLTDPAHSPYVGLANFQALFAEYLFGVSALNTLRYAAMLVLGMIPLSMGIAYCLANVARGRGFYQWAIFTPVVVSMVAMALLFTFLMDPQIGVLNRVLVFFGLPRSLWLTGLKTALPSLVGVELWKGVGFYVVLLTAGLLAIPEEIYDAAKIDGANAWQIFWSVTLPLLSYTLMLVTVMLVIGALQVYTTPVVLTGGGPAQATYVYNMLIVSDAFTNLRFGTATAAAFVLFAFIMVITVLQIRLIRGSGYQY